MTAQSLTFDTSSQSEKHLQLEEYELPGLKSGQVEVKILAAPINPQDLMVMEGLYPVKPENHISGRGIPGYDGVAEVVGCSDDVVTLKIGDRVIPKRHGLGTWRTAAIFDVTALVKVSKEVDPNAAAVLKLGVTPAYLLLHDMIQLKPGDWIIQNAATGFIAQMITQLAGLMGVKTISIVRDRGNGGVPEPIAQKLTANGADIVLSESELETTNILKGKRIVLALDCVFARSAERIAAHLSPSATFVNYGSLGVHEGHQAFELTQQLLFWKQITFRNFRLSECLASRTEQETNDLLAWFIQLFEDGRLKLPQLNLVIWDSKTGLKQLEERMIQAISRAKSKDVGEAGKQIIRFDQNKENKET